MLNRPLFVFTMIVGINCFGMEREELPKKKEASAGSWSKPCVYFLNGTTTAGKTSIALELAKRLECGKKESSLKILAIDTYLVPKVQWVLLKNRCTSFCANIDLITSDDVKAIAKESQQELCAAARAAYATGLDVIIDAPAYTPEQIVSYKKELAGLQTKWILVYCPIETLVNRVIERNEKSGIDEQRSVLQALYQFGCLYRNKYTDPIDTLSPKILHAACATAYEQHFIMQDKIYDFQKSIQNAICSLNGDAIRALLLKNLTPDSIETGIGPIEPHDLCINTKLNDPALCADAIFFASFNK